MCERLIKWKRCQTSKWGRAPKPGREKPTPEQVEIWVALGLELGRRLDEEYRAKLIELYGKVPDWAPERIRR